MFARRVSDITRSFESSRSTKKAPNLFLDCIIALGLNETMVEKLPREVTILVPTSSEFSVQVRFDVERPRHPR